MAPLGVQAASIRDVRLGLQIAARNSVWPVEGTARNDIASTFGPRMKGGTSYDWHPGIDIAANEGDDVYAAVRGEFWTIEEFDDGGTTVVLRHRFVRPVTFHGTSIRHYFTYYSHLSSVNERLTDAHELDEHPVVALGDVVGEVGHSGSATYDHLHFEVRVGTTCSLAYQLAHPTAACAAFGFDPHVHPLLLFAQGGGMDIAVVHEGSAGQDGVARVTTEHATPALNSASVYVFSATNRLLDSTLLDLSLRTGFDATTATRLDTPDTSVPYIAPLSFGVRADAYQTEIVLPAQYLVQFPNDIRVRVVARDVWGRQVTAVW